MVTFSAFTFATFERGVGQFPAVVVDSQAYDLRDLLPNIRTVADLFADWEVNLDHVSEALSAVARYINS